MTIILALVDGASVHIGEEDNLWAHFVMIDCALVAAPMSLNRFTLSHFGASSAVASAD